MGLFICLFMCLFMFLFMCHFMCLFMLFFFHVPYVKKKSLFVFIGNFLFIYYDHILVNKEFSEGILTILHRAILIKCIWISRNLREYQRLFRTSQFCFGASLVTVFISGTHGDTREGNYRICCPGEQRLSASWGPIKGPLNTIVLWRTEGF